MKLLHLHLPVLQAEASIAFYTEWFAFKRSASPEGLHFLVDPSQFLLILEEVPGARPLPLPFHFGFVCPSPEAVRTQYEAMRAAGVPLAQALRSTETLVSFRCYDPTGHVIELYFLP